MIDFELSKASLAICLTLGAFLLFWKATRLAQLETVIADNRKSVFAMRFWGVFSFLLAAFIYSIRVGSDWSNWGLVVKMAPNTLFWFLILAPTAIVFNAITTRRKANLDQYPQVRAARWSLGLFVISALSWAAYLWAYEWLFRGVLLPACLGEMPVSTAIVVNVALYSLVHLPKGMTETIAAIPFGFIVCAMALESESMWPAFLLHLVLALSNEWFSLYYHPEMKLER